MILLAPDKFKGTASASAVSAVLARELKAVDPVAQVVEMPIADGGEGTVDLVLSAGATAVDVEVRGPMGAQVTATYARLGHTAVIELASAAGIGQLDTQPDVTTALGASTYGVGELIRHAIDHGSKRVILGLGGSATTDGGAGMASALGAEIETAEGFEVPPGGAGLSEVALVNLAAMTNKLEGTEILMASDVDSPLSGPDGAARVYGPQKGADQATVRTLERGLENWADRIAAVTGQDMRLSPGSGAAGGAGYPLLTVPGVALQSGVEVLLDLVSFERKLDDAELVVVGEGSLDQQSLRGKGPIGVARLARSNGTRVVAFVGRNQLNHDEVERAGIDRVYALTDIEPDPELCITKVDQLLPKLARRFAAAETTGAVL